MARFKTSTRNKIPSRKASGKKDKGVLEMEMEGLLPSDDGLPSDAASSKSFISQKNAPYLLMLLVLFVGLFVLEIKDGSIGMSAIGQSAIDKVVPKKDTSGSASDYIDDYFVPDEEVSVSDKIEPKVEPKVEPKEEIKGTDAKGGRVKTKATNTFHSNSGKFGGINNIAHPGGAKAAARGEGIAFEDIIIPKSNVAHAVPSLNRPNIVNSWGHYVHDEHRSPYASFLYDATKEELEKRQAEYIKKMKKVRQKWGAWDFRDPRDVDRPVPNFSNAPYKDLPAKDFPADCWQADKEYVEKFLGEAKKLVGRIREGIYAEIGWPKTGNNQIMQDREKFTKIHVWDSLECESQGDAQCGEETTGIVSLQKGAFDGLVKKLLHAMMTNDEFYAVLAGHSAAAGHGNDFQQNRIITFQHMMEPVFDKLGMNLISRNMAMGGVGTVHFSLAGGDIYGEADIIEWDSAMTEQGGTIDLFNKQAILSGERVPVIITNKKYSFDIMTETNGTALMGHYIKSNEHNLFPETTWENYDKQAWAARWFNEKEEKFNAICWEPRSDFEPMVTQTEHPQGQASWHPGNRQHQWSGRKLALVLLEALDVAFERWEEGVAKDGYPLAGSYWHVGDSFKDIRNKLRTHINTPKPGESKSNPRSQCEKSLEILPRICRVQMHGFGMWQPRTHPDYDLLNLIHPAPNGYKPEILEESAYNGFDLLPLAQKIPDGEIDVHAIAIATTSPPPDIDHSWIEDENSAESGDSPPTRRWLREASEVGFRKGAEIFPPSTVVKNRLLLPKKEENQEATRSSPSSSDNFMLRRRMKSDAANSNATVARVAADATVDIVPGRGWGMEGKPTKGLCDGSAQSECSRNEDYNCLIHGTNDRHVGVIGNALSGWLVFTLPNVREGIILLRLEWWCGNKAEPMLTKDWKKVNNGMTLDTTPWNRTAHREMMASSKIANDQNQHRNLGNVDRNIVPQDLKFDYAINGVVKTMNHDQWMSHTNELNKNCAVWPLLDDIRMAEKDWDGEPVEVAIRYRSKQQPHRSFCLSHVYYA